jgi:hypothetical protein
MSLEYHGRGRHLFHACVRFVGLVGAQCRVGQVADNPAGDYRMVGRAGRIEEAFGGQVGVAVPTCSERGEDPAELREGQGHTRPGRRREAFGPGCGIFGCVLVAADPGDDRIDGVGGRYPVRLAELARQAPGLFGGGDGHSPVSDLRCARA